MSRGRGGKRAWGDDGWGERGGYMNAKKQKLSEQFTADTPRLIEIAGTSTGSQIFKGVSIHVNGYTVPSSDELKRLMMLHGGMYYFYYSKTKVSHIIATRLPYAKIKELRDEKIVQPDWILDSIKAGKLLSDVPYQLYTNRTTSQGTLKFTNVKKDISVYQVDHTPRDFQEGDTKSPTHSTQNLQELKTPEAQSMVKFLDENCASIISPNGQNPTPDVSLDAGIETPAVQGVNSPATKPVSPRDRRESVGSMKGTSWAGDANFVSEFYSNSRLHHISTWGAELKAFVNKLHRSGNTSFPGREKLRQFVSDRCNNSSSNPQRETPEDSLSSSDSPELPEAHLREPTSQVVIKTNRVIMHVDMDCFFVSVGLRSHPHLLGKPVAVTHSKGKGMPSVNHEAREMEKAYYENKYNQIDSKGLRSRHSIQTKDSLKETKASQRLGEVKQDLLSSKEASLGPSSNPKESPATPDVKEFDSGTTCASQSTTQEVHVDQAAPRPVRAHPEAFHSMAELASCSYEARKAGVRNGMFMGEARRRCPDLQTIPYDFEGYRSVSQTLYEIVASFTHDIEAVSCDEIFVDVTGVLEDSGATPQEFAQVLRQEIKEKTQCNASAGLASNILLARMSTRKAKPNGQFFLETDKAEEFMKEQLVKDLPGVGHSLWSRLKTVGIITCGDLQRLALGSLQKEFGPKTGLSLHSYCRGIDSRPIRAERERKSVSAEINYGIRFTKNSEAALFVSELAEEVHKRLTAIHMVGKTITLKLKVRKEGAPKESSKFMGHGICDNLAKSTTLAQATDQLGVIRQECKALLAQLRQEASDLRGVGIQISRLSAQGPTPSSSTSTSKSLLDFVRPLPRIPSEVGAEVAMDQGTKEKRSKATILSFVSKQKMGESSQSTLSVPTPDLPQPKKSTLPPLPTLKPKTPSSSSRFATARRRQQEQFCLPSPSQLDPSVMAALPADIRETIERSYEAQKEPGRSNLQGLPSTSSHSLNTVASGANEFVGSDSRTSSAKPLASSSDSVRLSVIKKIEGKCHPSEKSDASSLKSPCRTVNASSSLSPTPHNIEASVWSRRGTSNGTVQLGGDSDQPSTSHGTDHSNLRYDPSVLKELPPDIVQEILEQEGRRAGEGRPEVTDEDDEDALGIVEALPSFSQIDPSCLDALPSELQKELQLAYQRQHLALQSNTSPSKLPSGTKPSSPFKLHRRKGRPRKSSPRKGAKQGFKIPGTVDILEMVTGVKGSPAGKALYVNKNSDSIADKDVEADLGIHDNKDVGDVKTTIEPVSLCGAVALWDVKALLKEWTTSVEEPGDEDIDHLVLYLNELIVDRNLEMTDLVLRAMKRLANQMESTSPWRDAYQTIEDRVQLTISHMYSSKLKIV